MVGYAFHDSVFLGLSNGGSMGFGTCICVAVHACTRVAWDPQKYNKFKLVNQFTYACKCGVICSTAACMTCTIGGF